MSPNDDLLHFYRSDTKRERTIISLSKEGLRSERGQSLTPKEVKQDDEKKRGSTRLTFKADFPAMLMMTMNKSVEESKRHEGALLE